MINNNNKNTEHPVVGPLVCGPLTGGGYWKIQKIQAPANGYLASWPGRLAWLVGPAWLAQWLALAGLARWPGFSGFLAPTPQSIKNKKNGPEASDAWSEPDMGRFFFF